VNSDPVPSSESPGGGTRLPINRKALYSVTCGFAAFLVLWVFPFGAFVLGHPAVTAAKHGRREINLSKGTQGGDNLAVAGITAGAMTIALMVFSWLTS
jgi:hypothetical protein